MPVSSPVFGSRTIQEGLAKPSGETGLSTSTIGTHLYNVKQKLGASNQAELTLIALRNGLIEA